jgi:beta-galactosidase
MAVPSRFTAAWCWQSSFVFPHWNQPEVGKIVQVFCFTNCDKVELFLNARSYGKKYLQFPRQGMSERYGHYDRTYVHPTTADLHLSWDVPFEPDVLSAVGTRHGQPWCRAELQTTGEPASLLLEPDRIGMRASRRDISPVVVKIADTAGNTAPTTGNRVKLEVEGASAADSARSVQRLPSLANRCTETVSRALRASSSRQSLAMPRQHPYSSSCR